MTLRTIIVTATTAAVLATSGVAIAGATGSSAPSTPSSAPAAESPAPTASAAAGHRFASGDRTARRLRIRRLVRGAGGVVAQAIGIDRPALRQGLASGQTIAQIAAANHVDPQVVINALVNAAKPKLDAAVAAGRITAARAVWIEEKLPARIAKLVNEWHPRRFREPVAP